MTVTIDARAELVAWLDELRPAIDAALEKHMPKTAPKVLRDAVRHAALGAGKRLRPAMALAACEAAGGARDKAMPAAVAVELIHAYSLVHDDLPALDDDVERRGQPTVHVAYGEAVAILAGDALLTAAFGALARLEERAGAAVAVLAERAGADELIAGQVEDLEAAAAGEPPTLEDLERIHINKTGALFAAAAELGAIAAGADDTLRGRLRRYGRVVGIAFQYADDRDDGDFPELAEAARARGAELIAEARTIADELGSRARALSLIATWIEQRL